MDNYYKHMTTLSWVIEDASKVCAEWNGDEAGRDESRANLASEIMDKASELKAMIEQLEEI